MSGEAMLAKYVAALNQLVAKCMSQGHQVSLAEDKVAGLTRGRPAAANAVTMAEAALKKQTEARQKKDPKFKEQDFKKATQDLATAKTRLAQHDKDIQKAKAEHQKLQIQLDVIMKQRDTLTDQVELFKKEVETGRNGNEKFEKDIFVTVEKLTKHWGDRTKLLDERIKKLDADIAKMNKAIPILIQKQFESIEKEGPDSPAGKKFQSQISQFQLEMTRLEAQVKIWRDKKDYYVKKKAELQKDYRDKGDAKTYELLKAELKRALALKD